jgi:hypothetical protein
MCLQSRILLATVSILTNALTIDISGELRAALHQPANQLKLYIDTDFDNKGSSDDIDEYEFVK